MEELTLRPVEYIPPPLPAKVRQNKSGTTLTHIDSSLDYGERTDEKGDVVRNRSSTHSIVLNSNPPATVYVAASGADRDRSDRRTDATRADNHAVTIRVTDFKVKAPVISSVQLKSGASFHTNAEKKNNSIVRINVDERQDWHDTTSHLEKNEPFIYCNSFPNSGMVMSSGQCSPSDTLDSGTCSDLDSTPPPLPKKKTSKTSLTKSGPSVTLITFENSIECSRSESNHSAELDFEDNDSNISCDSLNSSELNGSINTEESNESKRDKSEPPAAPDMPEFVTTDNNGDNFLRQGLLQDIRDRSTKLNVIAPQNDDKNEIWNDVVDGTTQNSVLTSFKLVSQVDKENIKNANQDLTVPGNLDKSNAKAPLISESTYEDRQKEKMCYSSSFIYDADKFYDFHLNEKVFEPDVSVVNKCDSDEPEYFAGVKNYQAEETPSTIRSSKGTIRGVKNRVRAGIATFLQIQTTTKSYKEKDAGKVVLYTTTMGIVRPTYQRCLLVKKILRNLLIKYDERDVFMSTEYQDEIRDRMHSDDILVPQLFVDGQHIGDADTVEKLNESGELRKMLKPYKSLDACNTCQSCGGFRLLPCRVCNGSKKSLHRNHFTAEFVALKCMNCDEVGLVRCESCC